MLLACCWLSLRDNDHSHDATPRECFALIVQDGSIRPSGCSGVSALGLGWKLILTAGLRRSVGWKNSPAGTHPSPARARCRRLRTSFRSFGAPLHHQILLKGALSAEDGLRGHYFSATSPRASAYHGGPFSRPKPRAPHRGCDRHPNQGRRRPRSIAFQCTIALQGGRSLLKPSSTTTPKQALRLDYS